jgi:hypothetical protein
MNDRNSANEFFNQIKTIVDNYMRNRKPAAVVLGIYTGQAVMIDQLPVPVSMVSGNMKSMLKTGDKVRLLRNDGGKEYYILEIVGRRFALFEEVRE